jgi:hypothetical protein
VNVCRDEYASVVASPADGAPGGDVCESAVAVDMTS